MESPQPQTPGGTLVMIDTSLVAVIAWVVIAVIVILFLWKIWPLISKAVRAIDSLGGLAEHMEVTNAAIATLTTDFGKMKASVDDIHHETHKNDGSSIKDAVKRIEDVQATEVEVNSEFRALHLQQFGALVQKDEELDGKITEHIEWSEKYVKAQEERHGG